MVELASSLLQRDQPDDYLPGLRICAQGLRYPRPKECFFQREEINAYEGFCERDRFLLKIIASSRKEKSTLLP